MTRPIASISAAATLALAACSTAQVAHGPAAAGLGLQVGAEAPAAQLMTAQGETIQLASLYSDGPVVVTFYRGGWCPYCTGALAEWQDKLGELGAAGGTLVALTPDKPELTTETSAKENLGFVIYSDHEFQAADAFRVRFSLDEGTVTRYKGFGIDLAESNASGDWDLPHPGTFVINSDGEIVYAWVSSDFRTRANPDEVIAAVREAS